MLNSVHFDTCRVTNKCERFLISNFRHVLNVICFLLGNSPAPEFYMPTFRNTLFHFHRQVSVCTHLPAYEDGTDCSETSAHKIQTPGELPRRKHTTNVNELPEDLRNTLFQSNAQYSSGNVWFPRLKSVDGLDNKWHILSSF